MATAGVPPTRMMPNPPDLRRVLPPALGVALILSLLFAAPTAAGARIATRPARSSARARIGARPAYVPGRVIVGYRAAPALAPQVVRRGQFSGVRTVVRRLRRGERVPTALAALRRRPDVAFAYPDYLAHTAGSFIPDDPGRSGQAQGWQQMQWNMQPGVGVNAPEAWANLLADHRPGGRGVVVAVLDTGVAYRAWHQFRASPDFNRTRFVDPSDLIAGNSYPLDRNGHGTLVAGVIAESTNNGRGLTGLAYGASIMPVRVLDAAGDGDEVTIAKGIRYAVAHGAQVINLSLEFLPSQVTAAKEIPLIVSAVDYARRRGVVVVGAAGNDDDQAVAYPARVTGVISVGATTQDQCAADYTNGGSGLDLVAPGGGSDAIIPSDPACHPQRALPPIFQMTLSDPPHWGRFGYPRFYVGTSMSAPAVAATAALIISSRVLGPHPSPNQVLARLEQTATRLPAGAAFPNDLYGYGLLNAGAATARTPTPTTPSTPTPGPAPPASGAAARR